MWLLINNPNRRIAIFNWTEQLVLRFLRNIKDHFTRNPIFQEFWGDLIPPQLERRVWNQSEVLIQRTLIDSTPSIQAMSIQANVTGSHHDVHIYDDLVNKDNVQTAEALLKLHEQFVEMQCVINPPSKDDPFVGKRVMIGTRWHWSDEYQRIIDKHQDIWSVNIRRAIENGRVIFPQKFSTKLLNGKREEMGPWHFSAQFLNEPVDEENAYFPPRMIKRWKSNRNDFLQRHPCNVYMAIDPAWSVSPGGDSWGIVIGGMNVDGVMFVIDCLSTDGRGLRQEKVEERQKRLFGKLIAMAIGWKVQRIGFEATGGQQYLLHELKKECKLQKVNFSFEPLSHHNIRKEVRIHSLIPHFENGRIVIHNSCDELFLQLTRFPRGEKKDLIDALEMLMRIAVPASVPSSYTDQVLPGTGMYQLQELVRKRRRDAGGGSSVASAKRRRRSNVPVIPGTRG